MNCNLKKCRNGLKIGEYYILSDIFLEIKHSGVVGVLGRNGEGKTTLLNIIFGIVDSEKSVRIDHMVYSSLYRHPELMRMLPQQSFIPAFLTVEKSLRHFGSDFSTFKSFFSSIKFTGKSSVSNLSSGERRILEVFMILSSKSKFLLLDEPFLNLSPLQADNVQDVIISFSQSKGILMTDQLHKRVISTANRLYLLKSGKLYSVDGESDLESMGYISPYGC